MKYQKKRNKLEEFIIPKESVEILQEEIDRVKWWWNAELLKESKSEDRIISQIKYQIRDFIIVNLLIYEDIDLLSQILYVMFKKR